MCSSIASVTGTYKVADVSKNASYSAGSVEVALVPTLDEVNKPLEVAVVSSVVGVAEALPIVTNAIA